MKHMRRLKWMRLDNASKIFPATTSSKDSKVFRIACELTESIDPKFLQNALDKTMESFPLFRSVLRRGIFWYYLESSTIDPIVKIESTPVCSPIYTKEKKDLLFKVTYFNKRINLDVFHALADGTGALWFMQTLVYYYLTEKYSDHFTDSIKLDNSFPVSEKLKDSFEKHFESKNILKVKLKKEKIFSKACVVKGIRVQENRLNLIEASMSVKSVLDLAHEKDVTLTVYLASLFIYSIYKNTPANRRKYPVVLSVPINLRQYYESSTVRNFFSTVNIGYKFEKEGVEFDDILNSVSESFRRELTFEKLKVNLIRLISLEKNPIVRIIPLPIKDVLLKIVSRIIDVGITGTISNLGRIAMPESFSPYIRQFSVMTSARRPQICICSYNDRLVISFCSPFEETEIQRTFLTNLSKIGVSIEISSNN